MLLNQCLAISLSPIGANHQEQDSYFGLSDEERKSECKRQALGEHLRITTEYQEPRPDATLFQQLVTQNTTTSSNFQDNPNGSGEKAQALREALERVEYAGFVVPSWLLLSGSYNDLHCIKTNWSEGNFKSPTGFKIETIGK